MDWIKFGWGADFNPNFNEYDSATLDISNAIPNTRGELPLDIAINVVKDIASKFPSPFNLMVSGGVDSQAMLYAWLKSGVPFRAINFKYPNPKGGYFNADDSDYLINFCKIHKINLYSVDFDILNFLENELSQYAHTYMCTSPQICAHMAMIDSLKSGTTILSGNFIMLNSFPGNFTILGTHRFANVTKKPIIPFFFLHDPKLAVAFDIFKELDDKNRLNKVDSYERKCQIFEAGGFPILRQTFKMTGFERIKEYYDEFTHLINIRDRLEFASEPSKRVFDYAFRYKFKRTIRYNDVLTIRNNK